MSKKGKGPGYRYGYFVLALVLAALTWLLIPGKEFPMAPKMGFLVVLMAVLWISEAIPIAMTSLIPIVLMPLFGIETVKETASYYGKEMIFLFLGGLLLAKGLQESNLHKRLALKILNAIGARPERLVLGFMVGTAFLSMWISNTASVLVMMPIGISILETAKSRGMNAPELRKLGLAIMLGIAYSADMGGMATLVGTPPNMVFKDMFSTFFPDAPTIGFAEWMIIGLPISVIFVSSGWLILTKFLFRMGKMDEIGSSELIQKELKQLGDWRRDEKAAGIIFLITAILWTTGDNIEIGTALTLKGWRSIEFLSGLSDASIAVGMALFLFLTPSSERPGKALLQWKKARDLPWGILLLFGGGFALAGGFTTSQLSELTVRLFDTQLITSPILWIVLICVGLTFLTEFTSNTATTNLILPVLAKASVVLGIDPRLLMIPATLSASCAFMMPVASPTQAIIFGSGYVKVKDMIRAGIWFNLLGILIVTVVFLLVGVFVLGFSFDELPAWAVQP